MPREWQPLVNTLSSVQKLVHLAMRQDAVDEETIRAQLLKTRRKTYEATLTELAKEAGCAKSGRLSEGPALSELNDASKDDAQSIVNTHNYDLAVAIVAIATENPKANRNYYARRLQTWETNRAKWKNEQIAGYTVLSARSLAQTHFLGNNPDTEGTAQLAGPNPAAEPICQGWLNRGRVPSRVAMANPAPYHLGCLHSWEFKLVKLKKGECKDLWTG